MAANNDSAKHLAAAKDAKDAIEKKEAGANVSKKKEKDKKKEKKMVAPVVVAPALVGHLTWYLNPHSQVLLL